MLTVTFGQTNAKLVSLPITGLNEALTNVSACNNQSSPLSTAEFEIETLAEAVDNEDMTSKLANPKFDDKTMSNKAPKGWTLEGAITQSKISTGVKGDGLIAANQNHWQLWHSNGATQCKAYQSVSNLSNGYYEVTAKICVVGFNGSVNLYANDNKTVVKANSNEVYSVRGKVIGGRLELGISLNVTNGITIDFDDFTLHYLGTIADVDKKQLNADIASATNLLASDDYKNVKGAERSQLYNLANITYSEEQYSKAIADIESAIDAFKDAKTAYDEFVAAQALVLPKLHYASEAKYSAFSRLTSVVPGSAAEALSATTNIISARRSYVESNAYAERYSIADDYTDKLVAKKCDGNMPSVDFVELRSKGGEGGVDSDGNKTATYFDTTDAFWGSTNMTAHLQQTATDLPAGKYLLTVQARGAAQLETLMLTAGSSSMNLDVQHPSNIFGNGWDDYSMLVDVDDTGSLTIKIEGKTNAENSWFSFNDFRLVRIVDQIVLDETVNNVISTGYADNVVVKRSLATNKWNTLVLPFSLSASQLASAFGSDVKVAEFSNADAQTIEFNTTDAGIKANVPVLIRTNTDITEASFADITLVNATPIAEGESYSFAGTYNKEYSLDEGEYLLSNNYWWKNNADKNYKIRAFRAFIKPNIISAELAKGFNLVIDGQTTGLKLNTITGEVDSNVYSLAGQRVGNDYKGIVVKNGKKIINK